MTTTYTLDQLIDMRGKSVYDLDGDKVGEIDDIYIDDESRRPEWIGIRSGFIFKSHHVVPATNAESFEDGVRVPYDKEIIENSPEVDGDHIDIQPEEQLYRYHSVRPTDTMETVEAAEQRATGERAVDDITTDTSARNRTAGMAADASMRNREIDATAADRDTRTFDRDRDSADDTITRSEEEMHVGTREVPAGRVHLRKWVETERETETVPLRRETAEVTREPINRPATDADFRNEDVDVTLTEEQPVVEKEAVAKERIGINRREETVNREVSADVRRERVEVEDEADTGTTDRSRTMRDRDDIDTSGSAGRTEEKPHH